MNVSAVVALQPQCLSPEDRSQLSGLEVFRRPFRIHVVLSLLFKALIYTVMFIFTLQGCLLFVSFNSHLKILQEFRLLAVQNGSYIILVDYLQTYSVSTSVQT